MTELLKNILDEYGIMLLEYGVSPLSTHQNIDATANLTLLPYVANADLTVPSGIDSVQVPDCRAIAHPIPPFFQELLLQESVCKPFFPTHR